jgi:hypothetical protein
MSNKHPIAIGIAGEQPPISIGGTAVNLSYPNGHAAYSIFHNQHIGAEYRVNGRRF